MFEKVQKSVEKVSGFLSDLAVNLPGNCFDGIYASVHKLCAVFQSFPLCPEPEQLQLVRGEVAHDFQIIQFRLGKF